MSKQAEGLIAINIAAILFGSAALYGKLDISPLWIVAMRATFSFLTLVLLSLATSQLRLPSFRLLPSLFLTGLILSLHWTTFFLSVQLSGIAVATLTFSTFPLFTVLIEGLRNKRPPNRIELAAGILIVIAVKLLVHVNHLEFNEWIGTLAGLTSALGFAIFGVISKKLTNQFTSINLSLFQHGFVILILTPILFFTEKAPSQPNEWAALLALGILTTALMHQLYLYSLKRLSAATCSGFVALEPVYALMFGNFFFNEPVTSSILYSCILILFASLMLLFQESRTPVPEFLSHQ